jgi:mono/diheme cytochrome c family protein
LNGHRMHQRTSSIRLLLPLAGIAVACTPTPNRTIPEGLQEVGAVTVLQTPQPRPDALAGPDAAQIAHGRYLVELIGCGACHTDGAIVGEPNAARLLAGSTVGIAYTSPLRDKYPGVVYPANLTPEPATGLGGWTDEQIAAAIRSGTRQHGSGKLIAMSWPLYQGMSDADVNSIVAYLRSIPPVEHKVPAAVTPGTKASAPYVHFGVYRRSYP